MFNYLYKTIVNYIIFIFLIPVVSSADETSDIELKSDEELKVQELQQNQKIKLLSVLTEMPNTSLEGLKMGFSKESIPYWAMILGSTAILYHFDEDIYRDIQHSGRDLGIGNGDNTHAAFEIGPWPVRFPTDAGSAMYFLGDGITHFTIAGSLLSYGYFSDNSRPYNTGLQIFHGMAVSTFFSQLLKRSFGRESPYVKTKDFGAWRPFPSFSEYGDNTPKYDAMPSGHIMTATLTFTILIDNYPDQSYWLRPVEITWLSLLGYQMVNNGVHWASDYPLGIAMGYVFGKASAQLGRKKKKEEKPDEVTYQIFPGYHNGIMTTQLLVSF